MDADGDDNSQMSDMHVTVVETATGRQLKGDDAPLATQLGAWLDAHPGWEMVDESDDSDGSDEERETPDANSEKGDCPFSFCSIQHSEILTPIFASFVGKTNNDDAKAVISKAKVEDDEYKSATDEHTYYR